jgi:hypothetical protein
MKVRLNSDCGYASLKGIDFPIVVDADLYKGFYYVKKKDVAGAEFPSVPTSNWEFGDEYVFMGKEVEEL